MLHCCKQRHSWKAELKWAKWEQVWGISWAVWHTDILYVVGLWRADFKILPSEYYAWPEITTTTQLGFWHLLVWKCPHWLKIIKLECSSVSWSRVQMQFGKASGHDTAQNEKPRCCQWDRGVSRRQSLGDFIGLVNQDREIERSKRQERPNCFEFNINCDSPMFLARSYKDLHISSSEHLWPVETRCSRNDMVTASTMHNSFVDDAGLSCAHVIKQRMITEEDSVSEANVDDHFRLLEYTLEQVNHKYMELTSHRQVAVRKNVQELLYCPSSRLQSSWRQERNRGRAEITIP